MSSKIDKLKKAILFASIIIFICAILPIFRLSVYDRMVLDDLSYGRETHMTWISTHSIVEVLKTAFEKTMTIYNDWQGTWFTVFLFTLHPGMFDTRLSGLVVWIASILLIGSVLFIVYELLRNRFYLRKIDSWIISVWTAFLLIHFNPVDAHALYWWTGVAHYTIPLALAFFSIGFTSKYLRTANRGCFYVLTVFMILLGGGNYLAAFISLLGAFWLALMHLIDSDRTEKTRALWMILPAVLECVGLLISALAPGNYVRSDMEVSASNIFRALKRACVAGTYGISDICSIRPVAMLILICIILGVALGFFKAERDNTERRRHPFLFSLYIYGSYILLYWPEQFAEDSVSGGVPNTYYQGLIICILLWAVYIISCAGIRLRLGISGLLMVMLVVFLFAPIKDSLKASACYRAYDMLRTGRAQLFREEVDFERWLLSDANAPSRSVDNGIVSVTLPAFGYDQTPLLYSPVCIGSEGWVNEAYARYYDVDVVYGMLSNEWVDKYNMDTPDKVIWDNF